MIDVHMWPTDIRRLRGALGLTQADFALLVNAHPSTVSRWESSDSGFVPDNYQMSLMHRAQTHLRRRPEIADQVSRALVKNKLALALGVLLAPTKVRISEVQRRAQLSEGGLRSMSTRNFRILDLRRAKACSVCMPDDLTRMCSRCFAEFPAGDAKLALSHAIRCTECACIVLETVLEGETK